MWKTLSRFLRAAALGVAVGLAGYCRAEAPPDEFQLAAISRDEEVFNSQRGMYEWIGVPTPIPNWPTIDVYWRDQIQWGGQVEKRRGVYDFSVFENGLRKAEKTNGRFSFRIMALCHGCGGNLTPSYIPRQSNGAPAWNSEEFLSGFEELMKRLGSRYDADPRLGIIDIGAYGLAGEWYCEKNLCGEPITDANARRLLSAAAKAFPSKYLVVGFSEKPAELAAKISPRIGVRWDCVGGRLPITLGYLPKSMQDVWRHAPVVGEWCNAPDVTAAQGVDNVRDLHLSMLSTGNFPRRYDQLDVAEQAAFRQAYISSGFRYTVTSVNAPISAPPGSNIDVTISIKNSGVAPTYDSWTTRVILVNSEGRAAVGGILTLDLRKLAEGSSTATATVALPGDLTKGRYRLAIQATDNQGYLRPLAFSNPGRDADGRHPIGTLTIGE